MLNVLSIYFVEYIKYRTFTSSIQKSFSIRCLFIINHSHCYYYRSHCKSLNTLNKSSDIIQNWVLIISIDRARNIHNISCKRKNSKSPIEFFTQILSVIKYCNCQNYAENPSSYIYDIQNEAKYCVPINEAIKYVRLAYNIGPNERSSKTQ